ncbi:CNNM domain-containing protein [Halorubellus sp. PRR65]|uniref:CNNM domain-containing protein n=1 Tax=Halorubellus sp. PRR65 TaxID=3098148 RepID=UPI002B25D097|nr:CNNM domain-containing protein [Halorubellus sp. PRR65]
MVETTTLLRLFAGVGLLLGNGYFVTIEFAMTRVRQFEEAAFTGSRGLERAWEMTERLEIYLSGCQLGITICSVGLGIAAEPALAALLDPVVAAVRPAVEPVLSSVGLGGVVGGGGGGEGGHTFLAAALSYGVINIFHLTVGEQAPTYLGIERSRQVAKYGAPILYWWTKVFGPIITFADWLAKAMLSVFGVEITRSWAEEEIEGDGEDAEGRTRGELMTRMGDALSGAGLPEERRREVMNALAIDRIQVGDIMVDREDVVAVSTEASTAENFEAIRGTPHTRFPLVGDGLDDVEGVVYVSSLLDERAALDAGERTFADVAVDAMTVRADMPVSEAIDAFQAQNQELAIVEADGRAVGVVTATDAFEAIAGELEDPLDAER